MPNGLPNLRLSNEQKVHIMDAKGNVYRWSKHIYVVGVTRV